MITRKWEIYSEHETLQIKYSVDDGVVLTIHEIADDRQLSFFATKENIKELLKCLLEVTRVDMASEDGE